MTINKYSQEAILRLYTQKQMSDAHSVGLIEALEQRVQESYSYYSKTFYHNLAEETESNHADLRIHGAGMLPNYAMIPHDDNYEIIVERKVPDLERIKTADPSRRKKMMMRLRQFLHNQGMLRVNLPQKIETRSYQKGHFTQLKERSSNRLIHKDIENLNEYAHALSTILKRLNDRIYMAESSACDLNRFLSNEIGFESTKVKNMVYLKWYQE